MKKKTINNHNLNKKKLFYPMFKRSSRNNNPSFNFRLKNPYKKKCKSPNFRSNNPYKKKKPKTSTKMMKKCPKRSQKTQLWMKQYKN